MQKLTPRQVFEDFENQKFNKHDAIDLLIYLIENETNISRRESALYYFEKIGLNEQISFQFLENLMLSDYDERIRSLAAILILQNFPDKAYKPIKWVLNHEVSKFCLVSVLKKLNQLDSIKLKSLQKEIEFVIIEEILYFPERSKKLLNLNQVNVRNVDQIIGLRNLDKIEELYLQDNQILEIKGLENLQCLKILSLKSNFIEEIKGLENQFNLKTLYLHSNKIKEIKNLESLHNLNALFLNNNQISKISDLENLTNLKTLSLNDNQIYELEGFDSLLNLKELFIRQNFIKKIKGLEKLQNLKRLDLGNNRIIEIEGLESLGKLEYLNLNNNNIDEINGLKSLKKLKYLNISNNDISYIRGLDELRSLEYLCIENNFISKIEGLENLKNLKVLDLRNNEVIEIPDNIISLPSLRELNLINCPVLKNFNSFTKVDSSSDKILNLIREDYYDDSYRQPIFKEIIDISVIPLQFDSIQPWNYSDLRKNPIEFFCNSQLKVVRYSSDFEIYNLYRSGEITRI